MKPEIKDNPYPKPDRSDHKPNFIKTEENEALDIGWNVGVMKDGRPYRTEFWCMDQTSFLTFFTSTKGVEDVSKYDLLEILEREGLIKFKEGFQNIVAFKKQDSSGHEMWIITIEIAYDDEVIIEEEGPTFQKYNIT
jgi:hypothetical protein